MTTPLLIPVTLEHIVKGNQRATTTCAVALALRQHIPAKPHLVGYTSVRFFDTSGNGHYLTTRQELSLWLHNFDQGYDTGCPPGAITLLIDLTELFIGIAPPQENTTL